MSDIMPYQEESSVGASDSLSDEQTSNPLDFFNRYGIAFEKAEMIDKRDFPDRFGPDTSLNYHLWFDGDSLLYTMWSFSDSSKTINAFYNWIDCFGNDCKSLFVGEGRNLQKNALLIMVGDTNIVRIDGRAINFNDWYSFHDSLGFEGDWNYSIEQRYRSRAKWYEFKEGEKQRIETD